MLAADKDRLIAAVKQNALTLRHKELDYFVERYTNIATQVRPQSLSSPLSKTSLDSFFSHPMHFKISQASILAGFAFDSLVELEITEAMQIELK